MTIRCANCSLRIDRLRRHILSEESEQTFELVRRWVYPRDLMRTEYICHACWELINQNSEEQTPASVGHHRVCCTCSRSILRIRCRKLLKTVMTENDVIVRNIIAEWIQPRLLQLLDEVCIPCWLRAKRLGNRRQQQGLKNQTQTATSASDITSIQEPVVQASSSNQSAQNATHGVPNVAEPQITLPTTRRSAATARRCLFSKCNDTEKLLVPDSIRNRILKDFNFYIPSNGRICEYHLSSNLYYQLYTAQNSLSTFTAAQIEDMLTLLRN